ncbi:phage head morphogenesis protein [Bacteroides oleiciplenus]|nr:phage head morphogenesis protein [Bacteroides oleiciplenus]
MVVNNLYYEDQQLPDPDEIDYMSGTATPLQCKADDNDSISALIFDDKALQRALKHIYEKDFHPMTEIEENLFNETFRIFSEATDEGISTSSAEIPVEFRRKIDQSNAVFSAFKVHRMQNDIATRMYDSNGDLKPFKQWKEDVHPMLDHHVGHWLKTEYDTAVIRARQAADWQRFEQYADILPNLEWMPSTSANPGLDHIDFWGTILPINHPFWSAHRPGDRWNCKCSLSATDEPPTGAPQGSTAPKDQPAPGLDNNPGVDGKLFSDTHPYIANAYENAKDAVKLFFKDKKP